MLPGFVHGLKPGELDKLFDLKSQNYDTALCLDGSAHDSHQHWRLISAVDGVSQSRSEVQDFDKVMNFIDFSTTDKSFT